MLGFAEFLQSSAECKDLAEKTIMHKFLLESFEFLKKCLTPSSDGEKLVTVYCSLSKWISKEELMEKLEASLVTYMKENF